MRVGRALAFAPALAAALAGCTIKPAYVRPSPPVPASWPVGDSYLARQEAGLPSLAWREVFTDPRLQRLVEQALANNRDVRVAAANVEAARAQVRVTRAAQFPEVALTGSAQTQSTNGSGGSGTGGGSSGGTSSRASLGLGVSSFELDLFGRLANATAAERRRELSTEAAARTVRLGLVADLANAWAAYAADEELLGIARDTADAARRSVQLTNARLQGGVAPRTDLSQAQQVLETAQGNLAAQTTALAQDVDVIRLLLGGEPDPALLPGSLQEVEQGIAEPAAGTTSEVLLRRPDVVEAEYSLYAAQADIAVARAELFPRVTLSALLGLVTGGGFSIGGSAGAVQSIFDAGGRRARVDVTKAQRDAALAGYERAIQVAFREVADELAVLGRIAERTAAAARNTAAATDTARLTEARYRGGIDSFLASLDAQRSLFNARQNEITVRLARVRNRIALYRALGGDGGTIPL